MTAILDKTVDALREELQQYGEMLAVLEFQRRAFAPPAGAASLTSGLSPAAQAAVTRSARTRRESRQRQLAVELGCDGASTLHDLIPFLPENFRPLVRALIQENLHLLQQLREYAGENQTLLRQAFDEMQQFIDSLSSPDPSALLGEESDPFAAEPDGASHTAAAS